MVDAEKLESLKEVIRGLSSAVVAFSGGVDSSLLLKVCHDVLGESCLAVTVAADFHPSFELEDARRMARALGVELLVIETSADQVERFAENAPDRCYYCKRQVFGELVKIAEGRGLDCVVDGTNADDTGDYRPGAAAAAELGVRSPLKQAGLTKADIRRYSREMNLPTWDKPSFACLASRFPYGSKITHEALAMVAAGEDALREMGFRQFRVRHHGSVARIELLPEDIEKACDADTREAIVGKLRAAGYNYVTLDLQGFRSGSMNEVL